MKFVSLAVTCKDQLETPEQKLDDGESITIRVVELAKLNQILKGGCKSMPFRYPIF